MSIKRFSIALAALLFASQAAIPGSMLLLKVGGNSGPHPITTPTIVPQASAVFNQNQVFGAITSGLQPNGGTLGAFAVPTADATGSIAIPFEAQIDPRLGSSNAAEIMLNNGTTGASSGLYLVGNNAAKPTFVIKNLYQAQGAFAWMNTSAAITSFVSPAVGSVTNYNTGLYAATATGGGCRVEPSVVLQGAGSIVGSPGFDCSGWAGGVSAPAVISDVSFVGMGARQSTGLAASQVASSCAVINGHAVMTFNLAAAHGITPGMIFITQGFSGAGFTGYTGTYTALQGTAGSTLVGTTLGTSCPTSPVDTSGHEGTALSGATGNIVTFPAVSLTNPFQGGTAITTNNGRHICGVMVENGDDSAFPGLAAVSMVDDKGVALDGSPAIARNLNQGRVDFNGYTVNGAQATGPTPALNVTSMVATPITAATYSFAGDLAGSIRFTTSATNLIPGSEFTVSGASPSSVNITYVALAGTVPGGTVVVGNPLSGPNGVLQAISNPGAITFSSGQYVGVIMPGMALFGINQNNNTAVSPYGTYGGTGTGGVGSYGLTNNLSGLSLTGSLTAGPNATLSITAGIGFGLVTLGTDLSFNNGSPQTARITGYGTTGTGGNGNYTTDWSGGSFGPGAITASTIGDVGSPAKIMAFSGYYYSGTPVASSPNITMTKHTQANIADFVNVIGAGAATVTPSTVRGWGGALGNVGMLYGQFPYDPGGAPSATAVSSLCTKTTTIHAFAAANGMTPNSLYELDDIGIFGDSAWGDIHAHTAGSTLTIDSVEKGAVPAFSGSYAIRFSGPGLPVGGVLATAGSAGGPYTLASSVGTIASEYMKAGKWAPATPIASTAFNGYIDGSNVLHVMSLPTGTQNATFTGQLTSEWTGGLFTGTDNYTAQIFPGTGNYTAQITTTSMNVTAITGTPLKVGDPVNCTGCTAGTTISSFGTGVGGAGTYNVSISQTVGSNATFTNGAAAAQGLEIVSAITGTPLIVGDPVICSTCTPSTISALGTGTGGVGTYVLNVSQNIASTAAMSNGGAAGTGILSITSLQTNEVSVAGVGTIVNPAPSQTAFTQFTITNLVTGTGGGGVYGFTTAPGTQLTGEVMDGSGVIPAGPTTLNVIGAITGTIQTGSVLTDGGVNITGGQPPLITQFLATGKYSVLGNYFPAIASEAMTASISTVIPGEYIRNAALTTPVKIVAFIPGACANVTTAAILNGGLGCYSLSNSANGTAGSSSGSPLALTGTTISDGGAIAPGIALTIRDQGPATTFPVTNYGAGTGFVALSGTYDAPTLGGTPSAIQILVSNAAGGPALSGCTPCNWGTLTGTVSGGVWSGSISGIPAGGPYSVAVRAANGTAYATMPSSIRIGILVDMWGEGQNTWVSNTGGVFFSYFSGLWNAASYGLLTKQIANDVLPGFATNTAGDRFGVAGNTSPAMSEGMGFLQQGIANNFGWPVENLIWIRDGIGAGMFTSDGVIQTQTIDVGDGTKKVWCSSLSSTTALCPGASGGTIGRNGLLGFNMASLTGGWFAGSVAGNTPTGLSTLTVGTYIGGALEPGMVLSGAGISGSPKLLYCVTCPGVTLSAGTVPTSGTPQSSTWVLDTNLGTISSQNMRVDPTSAQIPFGLSSTPMPTYNFQSATSTSGQCCSISNFGSYVIKAGTFQLTDNGTVICQDTTVFAYGQTGGNCTGAGITSSFVNYQTGDYQFTFTTAPATGHVITAQWTSINSPDWLSSQEFSRPSNLSFVGDGTSQGGSLSNLMAKAPGGVSAHLFVEPSSDINALNVFSGASGFKSYQFGGVGYGSQIGWYYGTRVPNTFPGSSAATPVVTIGGTRSEGANSFQIAATGFQQLGYITQFAEDFTTSSVIPGSITSNVLTLSADAVGQMWEGEILGGGALIGAAGSSGTGVFITSIASGAWGKSGSTYNVSGMSAYNSAPGTVAGPFFNDVFYKGGNGIFGGGVSDVSVQSRNPASTVTAAGHMDNGPYGAGRHARRMSSMIAKGLTNLNVPIDPTPDRVKANATGCDAAALVAPCFDIGATFEATHAATWSTSGNVVTITGGITAHARPFVVGQAFSCSISCSSGLFITSVSLPPTQDARAGQGQVGQTFTFTVANASGSAIGGTGGSGTVHAGCSGTSGAGSNCIDIAFAINATGSFGTAKALATCGENNLNGNSPPYTLPSGPCSDNGVGTLIRTFRIGTVQLMTGLTSVGSLFDDGTDLAGGSFTQNGAFTCNIVSALVVQCVKGVTYASTGLVATTQAPWASGSTFISYGDTIVVTGRQGSVLGAVGGSSFPITNGGTGYANQTILASCPSIQAGGWNPQFDIKTNGGVVTDVYPSSTPSASGTHQATGLGILAAGCTITPTGGTGAVIPTIPYNMFEGLQGIATYNTDSNEMGLFLNDNGGFVGNPSNVFYTNGRGGYFEPGDAARPFGQFMGLAVSG